ncbi:class I SAM-dependent methyltransferase [Aestuariispira insulae]|uniref:Methyltransferase family protein n=1 Tax=Aestuariispira insulae TaxID=1461337 RepID=A0A3D9H407_9PROT|nr:class I SAM-dependent methyltransferase [Aestuariispira insulae]RED44220.1 methyltransferase family protein [Aestuariispira insulae]
MNGISLPEKMMAEAEALLAADKAAEALPLLETLARGAPSADNIRKLVDCCLRAGCHEAAFNYQKQLLALKPTGANWVLLAEMALGQGAVESALDIFLNALAAHPEDPVILQAAVGSLERVNCRVYDPVLARFLILLLERPDQNPLSVYAYAAQQVASAPPFQQLLAKAKTKTGPVLEELSPLTELPLLPVLLKRALIQGPDLETALIAIRKCLLIAFTGGSVLDEKATVLLYGIAAQCFAGEYIYRETVPEAQAIAALEADLCQQKGSVERQKQAAVIVACYRPIARNPAKAAVVELARDHGDPDFSAFCVRQIKQPEEEARIAEGIETLYAPRDLVSCHVKEQYEMSPYPRWWAANRILKRSLAEDLRRQIPACPIADFPDMPERPEILIAGCGTGQHAIMVGNSIENGVVTALDLSRNSLAYAIRKAREMAVTNITFYQADILELSPWQRRFDVIESMGVLHHMGDPMAGWRILTGLLADRGLMKIGLYSNLARQDIIRIRALIADWGFDDSLDGIRAVRERIRDGADLGEEMRQSILSAYDFYSRGGCHDLLLHRQEYCFSIPEISRALSELGLEFMGFQLSHSGIQQKYRAEYPDDICMRDLDCWHAFETRYPGIFSNMYAFWVKKAR